MATIEGKRLILRLAYAGPPLAGKTESIRALLPLLRGPGAEREIFSPGEARGRTLFFDWADYEAGVFRGNSIRCQITSVPGQSVLSSRRRSLVRGADAVILVVDSHVEGIEDGRRCYDELAPWLADMSKKVPLRLILQCNKQDLEGNLAAEEMSARLGLPVDGGAYATSARTGKGLRLAFVAGVRAAIERAGALIDAGHVRYGRPDIASGQELLERLQREEAEDGATAPRAAQAAVPAEATPSDSLVPTQPPAPLSVPQEESPAPASVEVPPASLEAPRTIPSAPALPRPATKPARPAVMPAAAWRAMQPVSVAQPAPSRPPPVLELAPPPPHEPAPSPPLAPVPPPAPTASPETAPPAAPRPLTPPPVLELAPPPPPEPEPTPAAARADPPAARLRPAVMPLDAWRRMFASATPAPAPLVSAAAAEPEAVPAALPPETAAVNGDATVAESAPPAAAAPTQSPAREPAVATSPMVSVTAAPASAPPRARLESPEAHRQRPAVMPAAAFFARFGAAGGRQSAPRPPVSAPPEHATNGGPPAPERAATTNSAPAVSEGEPPQATSNEAPRLPGRGLSDDDVWPASVWRPLEQGIARAARALPDPRGGWHGEPIAGWYAHTLDGALDHRVARRLFDATVGRYRILVRYLSTQRCLALTNEDDRWWLWQVVRRLPTLAGRLQLAVAESPETVADALIDSAQGYLRAVEAMSQAPEPLPLGLGKIGVQDGRFVYAGLLPRAENAFSRPTADGVAALENALRKRLSDAPERLMDVPAVLSALHKQAPGRLPTPVVEMICSVLIGH